MVDAGFEIVFIGIETPHKDSLDECAKSQNQNRDLVASVRKLQSFGIEVQAGFIIGFDNDPESIFQTQIDFIQKSGVITAMVGLLNAPPGTRLYHLLKEEGRLLGSFTGNNIDFSINFVPKMDAGKLVNGYKHVINTIYSPSQYYQRIKTFFNTFNPPRARPGKIKRSHIQAFLWSMWLVGICSQGRRHYWSLFFSYLLTSPPKFARFIVFSVYGYHFRKILSTQALSGCNLAVKSNLPEERRLIPGLCYVRIINMEITWLGYSCFRLKGKNTTVVTDPYSPGLGYKLDKIAANIITISHEHLNHSYTRDSRRHSNSREYEIWRLIIGVSTYHDAEKGATRGKNNVFVIEIDDIAICHLGDLGHPLSADQTEAIGNVDILLVPVGGGETISASQAAGIVRNLEPKVVIPMHYKTPELSKELDSAEKFLKEMGLTEAAPQPKLNISKSNLPLTTQVTVLSP
jgi:L-ascorbate metabolism protein UlaG (beta-lactamase superfamily)